MQMEQKKNLVLTVAAMLAAAVLVVPAEVFAWTAPTTGQAFYSGWDFVVNDLLKGPVGSIGGLFLIARGAIISVDATKGGLWHGVPWLALGGVLNQLDAITTGFGFTI